MHEALRFELLQTEVSRSRFHLPDGFEKLLQRIAEHVTSEELAELQQFDLRVILMTDEELLQLNVSSLGHDYYTDILTFEIDRDEASLEVEIYLSIDRARENATEHHVTIWSELALLLIHGILHVAGHDDHEAEASKRMNSQQRFFLDHWEKALGSFAPLPN